MLKYKEKKGVIKMKVGICSLGCKVNIYESEFMISSLKERGYTITNFEDKADIYIINTCSVTNESDKKSRKMINRAKKNNKDAIIIVTGCYSQTNADNIEANIILGNKDKSKIVEIIEEYKKTKENKKIIYDLTKVNFEKMEIKKFTNHTRAFVKIQDGCNAFCSYCIIPYVRGRIRSKNKKDVISEVTELVKEGYKEIVLTGIHTGKYGLDINSSLEELLENLVKIPGLYRIRLSSIEINEITPRIIKLLKENSIMAKHLHIPLQSGSDKILKLMNRKYTKEEFLNKIRILKEIPEISLTTDLIVGFPGETEREHQETLETLNEIKFTKIHTFPYSKRKGTPASIMEGQVSPEEKKKRVKEILEFSNKSELDFYKSNLDKVFDGVVEVHNNGKTVVHTSNFIPVIVEEKINNNAIVKIKITNIKNGNVYGQILKHNNPSEKEK